MKSLIHIRRGIGLALSLLFINAAFADSASDARIQAYKSNKLIPENIVLPTSTNATDSQMIVAFSAGNLKWDSGTASQLAMNALAAKYEGYSLQELIDSIGPAFNPDTWTGWGVIQDETSEEMLQYLSLIANGKVTSDAITADAARTQLQQALADFSYAIVNEINYGESIAFPCEGLDFTGVDLFCANLTNFTGLTASQVLSAGNINEAKLPAIAFTGTEDFSGKSLYGTDLSRCTGITVEQIMSADTIEISKLPTLTFSGTENFSGKSLLGTDLSKCTGITSSQIASVSNVRNMRITSTQYNEWASVLQSNFSGKYVYVDGVQTLIQ